MDLDFWIINYGVLACRSPLLPRCHNGPAMVRTLQWSRNCIWGQASATHPKAKKSTTSCDLFQVSITQVGSWRGPGHETAQEAQRARWTYLNCLQLKQHADQILPNHFCVLEVMKANLDQFEVDGAKNCGTWAVTDWHINSCQLWDSSYPVSRQDVQECPDLRLLHKGITPCKQARK